MRGVFDDELFVRGPRGMVPTPRAEALGVEVREVLERAAQLLRARELDPGTLERTFVVGTTDFVEGVALPCVVSELGRIAPRVSVTVRPTPVDPADALAAGAIDLLLALPSALPRDTMQQHLFDDGFHCVVRKGHPRVGKRMTLDVYTRLSHVLIAPRGEPGSAVDAALARLGRTRTIAVRTNSFLAAPRIVADSDLVLTAPSRLLAPLADLYGLRLLEPPVELANFSVHQAWHPRVHHDPVHAWFRGVVAMAMRNAAPARAPR